MTIERNLLKVTLNDIKRYVCLALKNHATQYVMLENDFKGQLTSNSEIYIDKQGPNRPFCSATCYATISPSGTFRINKDICGDCEHWVEYDEFCTMLYNYIVEEYQYVLNTKN